MLDWFLYFVQETGSGYIKIGIARDVKKRLYELQTGNHNKLILLGLALFKSELAVRRFEQRLHNRFSGGRVRGEWFKESADLVRLAITAK